MPCFLGELCAELLTYLRVDTSLQSNRISITRRHYTKISGRSEIKAAGSSEQELDQLNAIGGGKQLHDVPSAGSITSYTSFIAEAHNRRKIQRVLWVWTFLLLACGIAFIGYGMYLRTHVISDHRKDRDHLFIGIGIIFMLCVLLVFMLNLISTKRIRPYRIYVIIPWSGIILLIMILDITAYFLGFVSDKFVVVTCLPLTGLTAYPLGEAFSLEKKSRLRQQEKFNKYMRAKAKQQAIEYEKRIKRARQLQIEMEEEENNAP